VLCLSAAVTTLSHGPAPAHAQNDPHEKSCGETAQSESTTHPARPVETQLAPGHQRQGESAERNRVFDGSRHGFRGDRACRDEDANATPIRAERQAPPVDPDCRVVVDVIRLPRRS
jgi:hypothetical protein